MTETPTFTTWKTPLAEADALVLTSLNLGDALVIAFHFSTLSSKIRPLKIVFEQALSFHNTANPQALDYWRGLGFDGTVGRTFIVENLTKMERPFATEASSAKHYVIVSEEYVTEIISAVPPDVIDSRSPLFEAHL